MYMKLGTVGYLNTYPLVYGLEKLPDIELLREVPSKTAQLLNKKTIDAALVSAIEYFRREDELQYYPAVGISSRGAVNSIRLFGEWDWSEPLDTLYYDMATRSSVSLALYLHHHKFSRLPNQLVKISPPYESYFGLPKRGTAMLVIGDPAMMLSEKYPSVDLGEIYTEWTGRSFTYAVWVALKEIQTNDLWPLLAESWQISKNNWGKMIDSASAVFPQFTREKIDSYFSNNIIYEVSGSMLEDMEWFYRNWSYLAESVK